MSIKRNQFSSYVKITSQQIASLRSTKTDTSKLTQIWFPLQIKRIQSRYFYLDKCYRKFKLFLTYLRSEHFFSFCLKLLLLFVNGNRKFHFKHFYKYVFFYFKVVFSSKFSIFPYWKRNSFKVPCLLTYTVTNDNIQICICFWIYINKSI